MAVSAGMPSPSYCTGTGNAVKYIVHKTKLSRSLRQRPLEQRLDDLDGAVDGGLEEDAAFFGAGQFGIADGPALGTLVHVLGDVQAAQGRLRRAGVVADLVAPHEVRPQVEHHGRFKLTGVAHLLARPLRERR